MSVCQLHGLQIQGKCLIHNEDICSQCKVETHAECSKFREAGTSSQSNNAEKRRQEELKKVLELKKTLAEQHTEREKKITHILTLFEDAREKEEKGLKERREEMISALNRQSAKSEESLKDTEQKLDKIISDLQSTSKEKDSTPRTKSDYSGVLDELQKEVKAIRCEEGIVRMPIQTLATFGDTAFKEYLQSDSLLENIISRPEMQHLHTSDIQLSSKSNCWITGTCVFRNGDVVAVDRQNRLLLLFSAENNYNNPLHFDFYNRPYDVAVAGDKSVAVTLPWTWTVQFYDLGPRKIQPGNKNISVGRACYGIAISMNTLIVSCCEHFFNSQNMFQIYENEVLTQVIKCDKFGQSFVIADGYFDFCPLSERILFINDGNYTEMTMSGEIKESSPLPWRSGNDVAAIGIYRLLAVSLAPFTGRRLCLAKKSSSTDFELLDDPFEIVRSARSISVDTVSRILVVSEENSRFFRGCTPNFLYFFKF